MQRRNKPKKLAIRVFDVALNPKCTDLPEKLSILGLAEQPSKRYVPSLAFDLDEYDERNTLLRTLLNLGKNVCCGLQNSAF